MSISSSTHSGTAAIVAKSFKGALLPSSISKLSTSRMKSCRQKGQHLSCRSFISQLIMQTSWKAWGQSGLDDQTRASPIEYSAIQIAQVSRKVRDDIDIGDKSFLSSVVVDDVRAVFLLSIWRNGIDTVTTPSNTGTDNGSDANSPSSPSRLLGKCSSPRTYRESEDQRESREAQVNLSIANIIQLSHDIVQTNLPV